MTSVRGPAPRPAIRPDFDGVERRLRALVRRSKTPGLQYVVVDRSGVLFRHHDGCADIAAGRPMTADTTMMAYSMSKTVTAAAVLQLVESGKIGLDDPVSRHHCWQPYGDGITIRQLLTHTSGAPNPVPLRWVHLTCRHDGFDERVAREGVLRAHPRLAFAPGTKYAYSNIGYWLLGGVVELAAGLPFTSYVDQNVLRPLDVDPGGIGYTIDPARHAGGYLEKYSSMNLVKRWLIDRELIGDYAGPWLRIRDHYLNGPAYGGLVGSALAFGRFLQDQLGEHSRLFSDETRALLAQQQRTTLGRPIPMTLGWHVGSTDGVRYLYKEGGGGGFHNMMRLYPAEGIGTVLMTNATMVDVAAILDATDRQVLGTRRGGGERPVAES